MFGQKNQQQTPVMSPRMKLEQQYRTCRMNLLAVILFTLISMVTYYFNGTYFLFTAFVPLVFFATGVEFAAIVEDPAGAIASGYYTAEDVETAQILGAGTWLAIGVIIALLVLVAYFICWLVSKKHPGAMIAATVFFAADCIMLLLSFDAGLIIDVVFHIWVMYYLIAAIVASNKLKKLPPEEEAPVEGTYTVINGEKVPSAAQPMTAELPQSEQSPSDDHDSSVE